MEIIVKALYLGNVVSLSLLESTQLLHSPWYCHLQICSRPLQAWSRQAGQRQTRKKMTYCNMPEQLGLAAQRHGLLSTPKA